MTTDISFPDGLVQSIIDQLEPSDENLQVPETLIVPTVDDLPVAPTEGDYCFVQSKMRLVRFSGTKWERIFLRYTPLVKDLPATAPNNVHYLTKDTNDLWAFDGKQWIAVPRAVLGSAKKEQRKQEIAKQIQRLIKDGEPLL